MGKTFSIKSSTISRNADFEAEDKDDNSKIVDKTSNNYKQNPVGNIFYIVSDLKDILQSRYYEPPVGYNNVDWSEDEFMKLENKMAAFPKNTKEYIVMTEDDKNKYRKIKICRFCEKND